MNKVQISENTTVEHSDLQVHCDLNGEKAILHSDTGIYYTLNEVGSFIWDVCSKPISLQSLLAKILEEYDVDEQTAKQDLTELVTDLQKEGLLTVHVS